MGRRLVRGRSSSTSAARVWQPPMRRAFMLDDVIPYGVRLRKLRSSPGIASRANSGLHA